MNHLMMLLWEVSWQAGLVAALVWMVSRLARRTTAGWRYTLWVFVLIKFFIPPFIHLPSPAESSRNTGQGMNAAIHVAPNFGKAMVETANSPLTVLSERKDRIPPLDALAYVWIAGVCVMALRLGIRYYRQASFLKATVPAQNDLTILIHECASNLRVRRPCGIRLSVEECTPLLAGLFQPTIILPAGITESCSNSDVRAILMHELAHLRRRDNVVRWFVELAQVLFFFHPAIWLASREIGWECECACDELVLAESGMARTEYASGYVSAVRLANRTCGGVATLTMAEPFDIEKRRLGMILNNTATRISRGWLAVLLLVVAASLPTFAVQKTDSQGHAVVIAKNGSPMITIGATLNNVGSCTVTTLDRTPVPLTFESAEGSTTSTTSISLLPRLCPDGRIKVSGSITIHRNGTSDRSAKLSAALKQRTAQVIRTIAVSSAKDKDAVKVNLTLVAHVGQYQSFGAGFGLAGGKEAQRGPLGLTKATLTGANPKKVLIKAQIIDISTSDVEKLGIDWSLQRGASGSNASPEIHSGCNLGLLSATGLEKLKSYVKESPTRSMSAPTVMVHSNTEACLSTETKSIMTKKGAANVNEELHILPQVNDADHSVTMMIRPTFSTTYDSSTGGPPTVSQESIAAMVRTASGETVALYNAHDTAPGGVLVILTPTIQK